MKSLPARPSLESLRKHAKKLARDIAAVDAGAVARARAQLPHVELPLTLKQLLAEHPALLSWEGDDSDGGLLGIATGAYGDSTGLPGITPPSVVIYALTRIYSLEYI